MRPTCCLALTLLTPLALSALGCSDAELSPDSVYEDAQDAESSKAPANPTRPVGRSGDINIDDALVKLDGLPPPSDVPKGDVEKPDYIDSTGFFVRDGRLYDRYGNDFVLRGVNNAHAWFDTANSMTASSALDDMADYGVNSVRIVWEALEPALTPKLLRRILNRVVELQMIPMIELHDVTGPASRSALLRVAEYYTQPEVLEVLQEYEDYLLINIANEWCEAGPEMEWMGTKYRPCTDAFLEPYTEAIALLRAAGINHTLVIDANGWGQNVAAIFAEGPALLEVDPQHNLLFSTHMYESFSIPSSITNTFEQAVADGIPLIVGEFGPEHNGRQIDVELIFEEAARLGIGYLGWSWKGNSGDLAYLDLAVDWNGAQLTDWGKLLLLSEFGIRNTAQRASLFLFD